MSTHQTLRDARVALADLERRINALETEHDAAVAELDDAGRELARLVGLERLGEGDVKALTAARKRHEAAGNASISASGARGVLAERLPPARQAVEDALRAFLDDAADALAPERDRLAGRLQTLVTELQTTLVQFARVDAVVARIPTGTRTGAALLRAAGLPDDAFTFTARSPHRFTEFEILNLMPTAAEAAE